jgi:hypothetical protein
VPGVASTLAEIVIVVATGQLGFGSDDMAERYVRALSDTVGVEF